MTLEFGEGPGAGRVRRWRPSDAAALAALADDRGTWLLLRDRFPHPYTIEHARRFISHARAAAPTTAFAIEAQGSVAGGIGLALHEDVERCSAEIGYWVGVACRGRGLATGAVRAMTAWALADLGLTRVYALPFAHNAASCRVLEKAGFQYEGRLRRSALKDGRVVDQLMYARVRDEETAAPPPRP